MMFIVGILGALLDVFPKKENYKEDGERQKGSIA